MIQSNKYNMTKQEQKHLAWKEYLVIQALALEEYLAKCKKIDEQCDAIKIIDGKEYRLVD